MVLLPKDLQQETTKCQYPPFSLANENNLQCVTDLQILSILCVHIEVIFLDNISG